MRFRPSSRPFRLSLGERGEMAGWKFLIDHGYRLLDKNYRCQLGEIDVVAEKGGRLLFIEIKTRSDARFGFPEEAVTPMKQKRLIRLAEWYLKEKQKTDVHIGFEVLAIQWDGKAPAEFRIIQNAFTVQE